MTYSSKLKIACIVAIAGAGTIARKPHYTAPVVRHAADGERERVLMNWGFPLLQPGSRLVSVDDDTPASFPGRRDDTAEGEHKVGFGGVRARLAHDFNVRPLVDLNGTYHSYGDFRETGAGAANLDVIARVNAGLARARREGKRLGRPKLAIKVRDAAIEALQKGSSIRRAAELSGASVGAIAALRKQMRATPCAVAR